MEELRQKLEEYLKDKMGVTSSFRLNEKDTIEIVKICIEALEKESNEKD